MCESRCERVQVKIRKIVKDFPAFHGRGGLTKSVIVKMTQGARCAIRKHSATNNVMQLQQDLRAGPKHYLGYRESCNVMQLQQDLRAGPKHYLGYHESCNSEWCSEVTLFGMP